jgi:hypothetical protein
MFYPKSGVNFRQLKITFDIRKDNYVYVYVFCDAWQACLVFFAGRLVLAEAALADALC